MFIQNEHIYLRALEPSDLELLYSCENNRAIWQVSNTVSPYSKDVLHQYLNNAHLDIYTTKQLRLIICLHNSNQCVGTIDLFDFEPTHARIGIGVLIFENYKNNGFATQAVLLTKQYVFNHLLVNQLYCNISASNTQSIHLFEKCQFEKIGLKKQWHQTSLNNFEDEWMYQCLLN
jgi:diamine N-acetyltransferase